MNHDRPDYVTNYLAESIAALGAFAADAADAAAQEAPAHMADTTVAAMRAGEKC
jgi:hypothetical protein